MSGWKWLNIHPEIKKNRKDALYVIMDGKRIYLKDACNIKGINYYTILNRVRRHKMSIQKAFDIPIKRRPS